MPAPTEEQVKELFAIHRGPFVASERLLRSYGFDSTRSWIDPAGRRLSDRLWMQRRFIRDQIDQTLKRAIADGEDALITAKKLEQFLDPSFAPSRTIRGRIVRGQRRAIVTASPGRGGSGSMPARRLARTEISRAHSQGTMFAAARTPFAVGWRYNLSGSHPRRDPCDENARRDVGLGSGVYPVRDGPQPPIHPQCLCYVTIETEKDTDAVVDELRRRYGLS